MNTTIDKLINASIDEKLNNKHSNLMGEIRQLKIKMEILEKRNELFMKKFEEQELKIQELETSSIQLKNEQYYQKKLEKLLNGTHTKTKHGIVDIITKDAIYELKNWKNYKQVVGQLKAYSIGNSNKRLCAVFFGECDNNKKLEITTFLESQNIISYEIHESEKNDVYIEN